MPAHRFPAENQHRLRSVIRHTHAFQRTCTTALSQAHAQTLPLNTSALLTLQLLMCSLLLRQPQSPQAQEGILHVLFLPVKSEGRRFAQSSVLHSGFRFGSHPQTAAEYRTAPAPWPVHTAKAFEDRKTNSISDGPPCQIRQAPFGNAFCCARPEPQRGMRFP